MLPASTKIGGAVAAFPDVCKTPVPAGPVPIPYPNIAAPPTARAQQVAQKAGPSPAQLKTKLSMIHGQLSVLPGGSPNQWHALVDDYVMTAAALYIALTTP
jgi:hypothetical protein